MKIRQRFTIVIKESLKFALTAAIIFMSIGTLFIYMLIKLSMINDLSILLVGTITAFLIVIIDNKKLHSHQKIVEQFTLITKR